MKATDIIAQRDITREEWASLCFAKIIQYMIVTTAVCFAIPALGFPVVGWWFIAFILFTASGVVKLVMS